MARELALDARVRLLVPRNADEVLMVADIEKLESAARLAMGSLDLPLLAAPGVPERRSLLAAAVASIVLLARRLR